MPLRYNSHAIFAKDIQCSIYISKEFISNNFMLVLNESLSHIFIHMICKKVFSWTSSIWNWMYFLFSLKWKMLCFNFNSQIQSGKEPGVQKFLCHCANSSSLRFFPETSRGQKMNLQTNKLSNYQKHKKYVEEFVCV